MPINMNWGETLVRDKNESLTQEKGIRGLMSEDYTYIRLGALHREYKLGQAYAKVRNLEYRSDEKLEIQNFTDYLNIYRETMQARFKVEEKPRPVYPENERYRNTYTRRHYPSGRLLIMVNQAIYQVVSKSIDQYVLDVGREGYWAMIYSVSGGKPADVRAFIRELKPMGALLVGAIAVPWYEIGSDQFPCDLYYMDLNGKWQDPDGNGKFNGNSGDIDPEIWVGRLYTPTNNGNDAALINDYFTRNHKFRLGQLGHAYSALVYVDDDWTGFDDCAFDEMFPAANITKYTNPGVTDADLYKAEVNSLRSWSQVCAHSWVQGHAFRVGTTNEYISTPYFRDTNPPNAHFYNLFACGPGKFTVGDYLAGWYIFDKKGGGTNHGMAAIASAKSGSMLFFEDFYRPMGHREVIGDAFVSWWKARGPSHEDWERDWFYGLVLLGDPTLSWWKGAVPNVEQPHEEDVFDHYPRRMQFRWDPVNIPGVRYTIEVDAFGAVNSGQWAEETQQVFIKYHNITGMTKDHVFVGKQRGRWRVQAIIGGTNCRWSPWSYFRFTI